MSRGGGKVAKGSSGGKNVVEQRATMGMKRGGVAGEVGGVRMKEPEEAVEDRRTGREARGEEGPRGVRHTLHVKGRERRIPVTKTENQTGRTEPGTKERLQ